MLDTEADGIILTVTVNLLPLRFREVGRTKGQKNVVFLIYHLLGAVQNSPDSAPPQLVMFAFSCQNSKLVAYLIINSPHHL